MKRSYCLLFLVCFCLSGSVTFAQKIWEEGYVIKKDGTLLRGEVMVSKGSGLPRSCSFKRFDIAYEITYIPSDIKAFGYRYGNRFEAREINGKAVFLECLAKGKLSLLTDGKKLYVESESDGLVELKEDKMSVKGRQVEFSNYKAYLKSYTDKIPGGDITEKAELKTEDILKVIAFYNNTIDRENSRLYTDLSSDYLLDKSLNTGTNTSTWGFTGGFSMTRFEIIDTGESSLNNLFIPEMTSFDVALTGGLFVNKKLSRLPNTLSVQAELLFRNDRIYLYSESYDRLYHSNLTRNDVLFHYTGVKVPLYIQIPVNKGKLSTMINLGGTASYAFSADYIRNYETEYSDGDIRSYESKDYSIILSQFSAMGGISVKYPLMPGKYVYFNTRFEYGTGIYDPTANVSIMQRSLTFCFMGGFSF